MRCGSILARGRPLRDAKSGPTTGCCWPVGDHVGSPTGESIRALHLCLLGDLQRVVHFDPEIVHRALEFRVTQKKLLRGGSSFASISMTLSSAGGYACHTRWHRVRFPEPSRPRSEHTVAWTDAATSGADSETGSRPSA